MTARKLIRKARHASAWLFGGSEPTGRIELPTKEKCSILLLFKYCRADLSRLSQCWQDQVNECGIVSTCCALICSLRYLITSPSSETSKAVLSCRRMYALLLNRSSQVPSMWSRTYAWCHVPTFIICCHLHYHMHMLYLAYVGKHAYMSVIAGNHNLQVQQNVAKNTCSM